MKLNFSKNDKYANFIPRVIANLLDGSIFSLILAAAFYLATISISTENLFSRTLYFLSFAVFPTIILSVIYIVVTTSKYGKTLGKSIMGLEVADHSGKFLTIDMAIFRELFAKVVNGATFGFSYLVILFDQKHQGWHDQIAGTYVHQKIKNRIIIGLFSLIVIYALTAILIAASIPNLSPLLSLFQT